MSCSRARESQGIMSFVSIAGPAAHAASHNDAVSEESRIAFLSHNVLRLRDGSTSKARTRLSPTVAIMSGRRRCHLLLVTSRQLPLPLFSPVLLFRCRDFPAPCPSTLR